MRGNYSCTVRIPTDKRTQIAPRNEDPAKSTGSRMAFLSRDLSAKQAMAILSRGQHRAHSEETGHRSEGGRAHLSSRVAAAPPPRRLTTIDDRLAAAASPLIAVAMGCYREPSRTCWETDDDRASQPA